MKAGILFRRVQDCEEVPRGYGFVYVDWLRREAIYSPVPLNLLFGWIRAAWRWIAHDYYTRGMAQREKEYARSASDAAPSRFRMGIIFRWGSLWVGAHWSPANRRLCINLVPCVTVWVIGAGGVAP